MWKDDNPRVCIYNDFIVGEFRRRKFNYAKYMNVTFKGKEYMLTFNDSHEIVSDKIESILNYVVKYGKYYNPIYAVCDKDNSIVIYL